MARRSCPTPSLRGKRVGVGQGSNQEAYAKRRMGRQGVRVVSYQNQDQVYADLVMGRLDASLQGAVQASYGFLDKPVGKDFELAGAVLDDLATSGSATASACARRTWRCART